LGGLLNPVTEHAVVTVGPVEAYRLPLQELRRLKETKPSLYCALTETWYECLQEADLWITQFSCGSVRARVARLVNFLASLDPQGASSEVALLTCEEMAGVLAVTPESVSRVLADFKRSGLLSPEASDRRSVRYRRNEVALLALANEY
jgi:CRP/FNR family transcriptional regulator